MCKEGAVKKMVKEGDPSITMVVKIGLNRPIKSVGPGTELMSGRGEYGTVWIRFV